MNNYLLDRETLGEFVDKLMQQKPLDVKNPEELEALRESKMAELDRKVGEAIFGALDEEQLAKVNILIDNEAESEEYEKFFKENNVDVNKIVEEAFRAYAAEFLGGKNE